MTVGRLKRELLTIDDDALVYLEVLGDTINVADVMASKADPAKGRMDTRGPWAPDGSQCGVLARFELAMLRDGWRLQRVCTWLKRGGHVRPVWGGLHHLSEPVYLFAKERGHYLTEDQALLQGGDVWDIPSDKSQSGHDAPFPPALAERCIRLGCPEGGVVLDTFSGSGSTGVAAVRSGRSYIGIDLDGGWEDRARKRILKAR